MIETDLTVFRILNHIIAVLLCEFVETRMAQESAFADFCSVVIHLIKEF